MKLPDRLDYYVTVDDDTFGEVPVVFCTVPGCSWDFAVTWAQLDADDWADLNLDEVHPAHG